MYNCAIIGLGRIACGFDDKNLSSKVLTHAGAYMKNKKTKLIAFSDIDEKKLLKYGEKYKVKNLYKNFEVMFDKEKLDIVSICTHADSHYQIVKKAVKAGVKGIFLEKPISDSLYNAKKIIDICNKNNVKLQIDHQRRFSEFYQSVKQIIDSKKIGDIKRINAHYGSGIINTGTHLMDLIYFLAGDFFWVEGKTSKFSCSLKNDVNIDGNFFLKNGGVGTIQAIDSKKFRILEVDIIGENGRVIIDLAKSSARFYQIEMKNTNLVYNDLIEKYLKNNDKKEDLVSGVENLILSLKKNTSIYCRGEDGYNSLEICIALLKSAEKNGKRLRIPLPTNIHKFSII